MKNLNEPRRDRDVARDVSSEKRAEGEVISMEGRRMNTREEGSLVGTRQMEELRGRWSGIQAGFVDDPRKAVQEADALVSSAIKQIEESFRDQRAKLEQRWSKGGDASTEDLRVIVQHYRAFFDRLLSM
jgi:hypothetical protein